MSAGLLDQLKNRAAGLKRQTVALYLAGRDPRTPWYAKAVAVCTVAYVLSPVDLVPDFIPVLGYLDDLVLIPAGIALFIRLVPTEVWNDCAARSSQTIAGKRAGWIAAIMIVLLWLLLAAVAAKAVVAQVRHGGTR